MHYSTMCQIKSNQTNSMLKEVIHGHDNRFRALCGDVCGCACVCVCVCVCACVRACVCSNGVIYSYFSMLYLSLLAQHEINCS